LGASAAAHSRAAAEGDHHNLLAHSLAQLGIVRDLPVARSVARRHARKHDPRFPYALPLPEFRRDRRPLPRGAYRARILDDLIWRTADTRRTLTHLHPVAAGMGGNPASGAVVPREGPACREAFR